MKKKSFPDMTGDGKVTKKDILKGRGVPGFSKGGMVEDLGSPKEVSVKSAGGRSTMRGMGAATRGGKFQGVF